MQSNFSFPLHSSWQEVLKDEFNKPYILDLINFINREYELTPNEIYPPRELVFNALNQTPYDQVKVVIVGQDPYHGPGQANGLSFSVPKGIPNPPSLKNIFKELNSDLGISIPAHGCLIPWTKSGVLLLNATLTVRRGSPTSHHGKGWEIFTDSIIHKLMEKKDPLIFVLWGKVAQNKCRFILNHAHNSTKHFLLTAAHPSPFSANNGFFGCRHFSKINQILIQQGKKPIEWAHITVE